MLVTKNKTIILNLIDNGSCYITYSIDKERFMINKNNGEILYPEISKFNAAELINIAKHLVNLWKQNNRELPMFIELNLN